jgi:predicted nucleotidyltransferase
VGSRDIASILRTLSEARVRYVVVGGVAVVLHGHLRLTADLDLVVALDRANVISALEALEGLGYRPHIPVAATEFADPDTRATWIHEKSMKVFSLWSPRFPGTGVDLFIDEPIPFRELESGARDAELQGVRAPIASIEHLIAMKEKAGRTRDLEDIAALRDIALLLKGDAPT